MQLEMIHAKVSVGNKDWKVDKRSASHLLRTIIGW